MGIPQKSTKTKTRRRLRDLDQIKADLTSPKHLEQHKNSKSPEDLPGLGQYYCVECAKWFESEHSMVTHRKGSTHKRQYANPHPHGPNPAETDSTRVKALKAEPYTQKEAEAAIGLRTDNGLRPSAKENTHNVEVEMENS
ncbi:zinc finger containing protein [Diplocarpon rosae]|nr:zinc finger containing protein [Diplocarpon rosae]